MLVGNLLVLGDGKRIDAEEIANSVDDNICPTEVNNCGKNQVPPEVVKFESGAQLREADARHVAEETSTNKRPQHHSPVREWLASKMGENHLGGHAAKDKRHGDAEEYQVVVCH